MLGLWPDSSGLCVQGLLTQRGGFSGEAIIELRPQRWEGAPWGNWAGVTECRHSKEKKGPGVGRTWDIWETTERCVMGGKEGGFNLSTCWRFQPLSGGVCLVFLQVFKGQISRGRRRSRRPGQPYAKACSQESPEACGEQGVKMPLPPLLSPIFHALPSRWTGGKTKFRGLGLRTLSRSMDSSCCLLLSPPGP